jgi:general secretion pathway protein D
MIEDGQALVLGGLIKDDLLESEQRVPGLGDIPILGWLFKYKKVQKVKTNLMVFMHPMILRDAAITAATTNAKYDYMRAKQLRLREEGLSIMDSDEVPVLQEMKQWLSLPPPYEELQSNMPKVPEAPAVSKSIAVPADVSQEAPLSTGTSTVAEPPTGE